jgi:hypothetical protein
MMTSSRRFAGDSIGIVFVLAGLIAVLLYSLAQWVGPTGSFPGSVENQGPEGAQGLAASLIQLGYQVRTPDAAIAPQPADKILFVLAPDGDFSTFDLLNIESWVRAGGTLIIAQDANQPDELLRQFGLRLSILFPGRRQAELQLPTLNWPWVGTVEVEARRQVRVDCGKAAVHLGDCATPIFISFGQGNGQVYVMSTLHPFTNAGLQQSGNARFVQNLVQANALPGETIVFDEVHRDRRSSWLFQTREGWGLLFSLLALLVYLIAHRQRFGGPRPTTQQHEPERRRTAEFITAIANVDPTHQHTSVRRHYWQRLKRQLGRRYGLDPALSDQHFLAELKRFMDDYELSKCITLLITMNDPVLNNFELQEWTRTVLDLGMKER